MATQTDERIDRARRALAHLEARGVGVLEGVLEAFSLAGVGVRPTEVLSLWQTARAESGDDPWRVRRRIEGAILTRSGLYSNRKGRIFPLEPAGRILHAFLRCERELDTAAYLSIARAQVGALPDPPHHVYVQYYLGDDWEAEEAHWTEDDVAQWIEGLHRRGVIPSYDLSRCDLVHGMARDPVGGRGVLFAALRLHDPERTGGEWRPFLSGGEDPLDSYRILCECGKHIRIKEDFAGKRGKCPKCQKKFACLNIGKVPSALDHLIVFHHDSREAARSSLEVLIDIASRGAPGPACVARLAQSLTHRRMLSRKETDPETFAAWWDRIPLKVRQTATDRDRTALYVREADREAWLERIAARKRQVSPGGKQSESSISEWREYGLDTIYPIAEYALLALGDEAAGTLSAEERAQFRLPEGAYHGYTRGKGGDPARFFALAKEIAASHCKRTVYVGLLESPERSIVTLTGRQGSLAAFQKAYEKRADELLAASGDRAGRVRPEWSVTNQPDLASLQLDERFFEDLKNSILAGEYQLIDRFSVR